MTSQDGGSDDPRTIELGARLATWLEELGLDSHLAESGLPSFTRDPQGRPVWSEPGSGEPLALARLEELDRVLHSEGSDPRHAVPVPLLLLARQARLRDELLASPWFTYETLAELRGASLESTRFAVHKAGGTHRLLVVPADGRVLVPAFQLDDRGELRPELGPVLEPLLAAGMDPWRAWAWLTQPAGLLGGLVPERAAADPEHAVVVARAAERLAERVAADR
ncbi:hypothetical protein ACT8ZV_11700 [Nocardioides sp. MAHUQ-72]|uniref:hypothetical protein n=1 Tax=unclassified Nocardioides TaxID=2615069 RepID=UPI003622165D